ncbi:MAG: hypothetical protein JWN04_2064 [Myxococcaceae bacterium]|nr:hypothetical protein [Myxococcaceae bacterium]
MQSLMRETEALRGLKFRSQVQVTIEDRAAMRAYVERAIDDEQLARATRRYLALGALDPQTDVRALLVSVMEEELIGYYDPIEKRLAVRNDIARALDSKPVHDERSLAWRATVVHELVHALQDQHFALGESIKRLRSTDADNAFGALVEGEATLVMLAYTAAQAGSSLAALTEHPEQIRSIMTRTPEQLTGALRRAPALLREPLLFRYREGAHFCAELYRAHGWTSIDRAHAAPPKATASIRHAARYLAGEREPSLPVPTIEQLGGSNFAQVDEDVLGALELSLMLGSAALDAQNVVARWRGDRYAVFEKAGHLASVWWLRFDNKSSARMVTMAFERLADGARKTVQSGNLVLVTRGLDDAGFAAAEAWFQHASTLLPRAAAVRKSAQRPPHRGDPLASAMHRH